MTEDPTRVAAVSITKPLSRHYWSPDQFGHRESEEAGFEKVEHYLRDHLRK